MKKIVFLLIAVLLLGTFVACDGEADFLLWDDEPVEKVLKLKFAEGFYSENFSFDSENPDDDEKEFPIPDSVTTWQNLIDYSNNFNISVYIDEYHDFRDYSCTSLGTEVCFESENSSFSLDVYLDGVVVLTSAPIDFSKTYTLGIDD